ncbi:damage-inducible protein DinB [Spirochaetia bacterium]|nr:damage-inducible protein DinB [Spirochaetia bacterium]
MTKDTFTLLAKYNKGANEQMDEIIKTLSGEEWDRQLGGFFTSLHSVCSHLYISDFTILKRNRLLREYKTLGGAFFDQELDFKTLLFSSPDEYITKRSELDAKLIDFINELNDEDLRGTLKFLNYKGIPVEKRVNGLLLLIFNHQTHHRGMISLYLELLGKENDFSSLMPFL